ncbi:formylglycine-generating enzyme family protein [Acinetobacter lactucae]|uniref:formylglycine-generating enzyme family protein n=1 Tax=Acinetobacter lactucae TaxID=1785128 RepID=UPI00157FFF84|nr:SUMF1/EgtB/PvdO family nonheme iron enzyme [Acinetobacter lactucae]NUF16906.1 SUMF1/EgtB/PvdO family nonheme iron enzyme [Acinetobacter lactucae]
MSVLEDIETIEPIFNEGISHAWSARKLMGLPDRFTYSLHEEKIQKEIKELMSAKPQQLINAIDDKSSTTFVRLAAGRLLALIGDPRIVPLNPIMIEIKGGKVTLGLDSENILNEYKKLKKLGVVPLWIQKECPKYIVKLESFRISKYLITNTEYATFLSETGHDDIPSSWQFGRFPIEKSNHPVYTIKPESADAYTAWLSIKTGKNFRLPSEAEWEYVASGLNYTQYPWGDDFKVGLSNTAEFGLLDTSPVGCFPMSNSYFGCSDMAGNVEEYVSDSYHPYPNGKIVEDDLFNKNPEYRIARGGSFTRFHDLARTRRRHGWNPDSPIYVMGFRIAEDI